ncbi:uncharacterized protein B4U79_03250, partial [Dinothrombium tinctorium]
MNLIQDSTSEWASPILIVLKDDPNEPTKIKRRFVTDFRQLNACTLKDPYPMPLIADIMLCFANAKYFTALDLNSGFWQILLRESDRMKTAFVTLDGLYEYKQVRSFCGLASFYRQLIPNFSLIMAPLYALTQKNVRFHWGESQQNAFERIKDILCSEPVISHFDPKFPIEVRADACDFGLGAVLEYVEMDKLFAFPVLEINETVVSLKDEQNKDPQIKEIREKLEQGTKELKLIRYIIDSDGVVYRQGSGRNKGSLLLVIPRHLIDQ